MLVLSLPLPLAAIYVTTAGLLGGDFVTALAAPAAALVFYVAVVVSIGRGGDPAF